MYRETYKRPIPLADLAMCLADVVDCVDGAVAGHHHRVSALCNALGDLMELPPTSREHLTLAGAVHDIGALSLSERLHALRFDVDHSEHSLPGYLLLRTFEPFSDVADIVRWHHVWHSNTAATERESQQRIPRESGMLFFADRVAVLASIYGDEPDLIDQIRVIAARNAGSMFAPDVVDAVLSAPDTHGFWRYLHADAATLAEAQSDASTQLPWDCLEDFAVTVSKLIDFRCSFTASHSSGVAACAQMLAALSGMSSSDIRLIRIAGYLHDVGKLAVPRELIERTGPLSDDERDVMRSHVSYSSAALWRLGSPPQLQMWVGRHHERPNGTGYPSGLGEDDLDTGCRVLALADVFVALTETRPYRAALGRDETVTILREMGGRGDLDATLVERLIDHYSTIDRLRIAAQRLSRHDFDSFRAALGTGGDTCSRPDAPS